MKLGEQVVEDDVREISSMLDGNKMINFQENTVADSTHKRRSQAVCKWNRCTDSFPWLVATHFGSDVIWLLFILSLHS